MPIWIRALSFLIIAPGTIAGLVPWYIAGRRLWPRGEIRPIQWTAFVLIAGGWAVLLWCFMDFGRRGRGTPAPYDPPRALVVSGLYRFTRNPMYVGLVTAITGDAILFWSRDLLVYAAVVWLAFHLRVLIYEEPTLRKSFGEAYTAYCARVPRWFPRLTAARPSSTEPLS